jgi:hypothetical protein
MWIEPSLWNRLSRFAVARQLDPDDRQTQVQTAELPSFGLQLALRQLRIGACGKGPL